MAFTPTSYEGTAAWDVAQGGVWRTGGLSGQISGIDMDGALSRLPAMDGASRAAVCDLLRDVEMGALAGASNPLEKPLETPEGDDLI